MSIVKAFWLVNNNLCLVYCCVLNMYYLLSCFFNKHVLFQILKVANVFP